MLSIDERLAAVFLAASPTTRVYTLPLLSLLTLAIIYGYLMEDRVWVRVVLAIAAVPIAVVANSFRIVGTGLLIQYWDPDKAEGFFHLFEGWLIFVVSLILLFATHSLINRIWKKPGQAVRHA